MQSPLEVFRDGALAGHVALVTGGGTGICRGIARAYARLGADVCIVSRKPDVLERAAAELSSETGRQVIGVAADVRQPDAIASAIAKTIERFGKLDTLVNGAAGNFLAPAAALSPNGFRTVIDIDLVGTFHASRAAFEALQKSGNGLVLNISATLHYHGTPLQIHASAAKAGVDAITKNLAVEWGRFGIRACGIAPGPIGDTEGMRRLAPGDIADKAKATIPAGRFGTIDEIAAAAVFLRSHAAAYITGHVLVVDGGHCVATPSVIGT
jgi:peroxisomal 2,4-dienoyl-CoA reductase